MTILSPPALNGVVPAVTVTVPEVIGNWSLSVTVNSLPDGALTVLELSCDGRTTVATVPPVPVELIAPLVMESVVPAPSVPERFSVPPLTVTSPAREPLTVRPPSLTVVGPA